MTAALVDRKALRGLLMVVGKDSVKRGASMAMALRVCAHARSVGCMWMRIRHSRVRRSNAVYIDLISPSERHWLIRIANHHRPDRAAVPNIDLVSKDGVSGEDWLNDCVSALAVGSLDWFDSAGTMRPATPRERKAIAKSKNAFGVDLKPQKWLD